MSIKNKLSAGAAVWCFMGDGDSINQRGRTRDILCVYVGAGISGGDCVGAGWPDANRAQPWIRAGICAPNAQVRVPYRILPGHVSANKTVTGSRLIYDSRAEAVNVLNQKQPVILFQIGAKPGNIGAAVGQRQKLRRIRDKESDCNRTLFADAVINVRVELILAIGGYGGARIMAVREWRREQGRP